MLCIDVFAENPGAGAANEISDPFDGILPKRLIDRGIVDDADQVAQPLTIIANGRRRSRVGERSQM